MMASGISQVNAWQSKCEPDDAYTSTTGTYCVLGQGDGNGNTIFTIFTSKVGWFGFCGGSDHMKQGDMVIGYLSPTDQTKTETGSYQSSGYGVQPNTAKTWTQIPIPSDLKTPSWAKIAFAAKRSNAKSSVGLSISTDPNTPYMLAFSDSPPSNPETGAFPEHGGFDMRQFNTNFATAPVVSNGPTTNGTAGGNGNGTTVITPATVTDTTAKSILNPGSMTSDQINTIH
ncbi:hypothetical protein HDU76_004896, partial [Blyttiomyces sp. JEL0837]